MSENGHMENASFTAFQKKNRKLRLDTNKMAKIAFAGDIRHVIFGSCDSVLKLALYSID